MAWLLSQVPNNRRLITIEEGSREFDLIKRDENGNILMVQDTLVCILNIMLESRILALVQRSRPSISLIQWRH